MLFNIHNLSKILHRFVKEIFFYLDDVGGSLPLFEIVGRDNENCDTEAYICLQVTYSDNSGDFISASRSERSETVLKGKLASNGKKAVVIRSDEDNPEDTVRWMLFDNNTMTISILILFNDIRYRCLNEIKNVFHRLFSIVGKPEAVRDLVLIYLDRVQFLA